MARNPITWRNIGATVSPGAGAQGARAAQSGVMAGVGALERALSQYQEDRQNSWDTLRENNTQDFLDQLSQYRSAEDFQAAQERGALQQLYQGYGNAIDRDTARTALDSRLGALQQRDTATQQFQDMQQKVANRDLRAEYMDLKYQGRNEEADRLWQENRDLFVDAAGLRSDGWSAETSYRGEQRSQAGERRAQANHAWNLEQRKRTREIWESEAAQRDLGRQFFTNYMGQRDAVNEGRREIAANMGLLNEHGQLRGDATEEQIQTYRTALLEQGLDQDPMTITELSNTAALELLNQNPNADLSDAMALRENLLSSWDTTQSLGREDQRRLDGKLESIQSAAQSQLDTAERNLDRQKRDNIFLADMDNPAEDIDSLVSDIQGEEFSGFFRNSYIQKNEAIDAALEVSTQGIEIEPGVRVRMPPALFRAFLARNVDNDWKTTGKGIRDGLREFITENRGDYVKAQSALENYQNTVNEINLNAIRNISSEEERARSRAGLSQDPADMLDVLDRRLRQLQSSEEET